MNKFCLAVLIALAAPSLAMAGGGGSKATGAIRFVLNQANSTAYVIVASADKLASTNASNFVRNGGRTISSNESVTISGLRAGIQNFAFAVVPQGSGVPSSNSFTLGAVRVDSGETVNISLPSGSISSP